MNKNTKLAFTVSVALHTLIIIAFAFSAEPQKRKEELKLCSLQNVSFAKEQVESPKNNPKRAQKEPKKKQTLKEQSKNRPTASEALKTPVLKREEQKETEPLQQTKQLQTATPATPQKSGTEHIAKIEPEKEYLKANLPAIREAIKKFKRYPPIAVKMGYEGVVKISFRLTVGGTVDRIEVVGSSGFSILDKSSLKTVEEAAEHMPKPPSSITITVPIEYRLE